jgi:pyrimidine-nucleoside phosphorylase
MESIRGYRVALSQDEFREHARKYGLVLAGQSTNLAPADGKLYAIRDVTGTVASLPLIASSIMSKKIAAGAGAIVLDVKVGLGAFMTHIDKAKELAHLMVDIGHSVGRKVVALLSDMNQPLGNAVGNALEVAEAIDCLHGRGPLDLREHCLAVSAYMLRLARRNQSEYAMAECMAEAAGKLDSGAAFDKFRMLVQAQGGDVSMVDEPENLPRASLVEMMRAGRSGYIDQLSALQVGLAAIDLGAGRERKDDSIDHAVGIIVHKKVGDSILEGEPIFTLHANDPARLEQARRRLENAVVYSHHPTAPLPTFYDVIEA